MPREHEITTADRVLPRRLQFAVAYFGGGGIVTIGVGLFYLVRILTGASHSHPEFRHPWLVVALVLLSGGGWLAVSWGIGRRKRSAALLALLTLATSTAAGAMGLGYFVSLAVACLILLSSWRELE